MRALRLGSLMACLAMMVACDAPTAPYRYTGPVPIYFGALDLGGPAGGILRVLGTTNGFFEGAPDLPADTRVSMTTSGGDAEQVHLGPWLCRGREGSSVFVHCQFAYVTIEGFEVLEDVTARIAAIGGVARLPLPPLGLPPTGPLALELTLLDTRRAPQDLRRIQQVPGVRRVRTIVPWDDCSFCDPPYIGGYPLASSALIGEPDPTSMVIQPVVSAGIRVGSGVVTPGDGILQLFSGDTIIVRHVATTASGYSLRIVVP